jgi:hypothetical protein
LYLREGANRRWRTLITYTRPRNEKFHHYVCSSSDNITEIETRGEFYDMLGRLMARKTVLAVLVKKTRKKENSLKM